MAAELGGDVVVVQRDVVHVHAAVHDADGVPLARDHALHEHLLGVERIVEHDDIAGPGLAELVHQLVDDQPVVILERRRHAQAVHPRHLKPERHDQRRIHGGGHQRLQSRHDLAAHPLPRAERIGHDGRRRSRNGLRHAFRKRKWLVGVIGGFGVFAHELGCRSVSRIARTWYDRPLTSACGRLPALSATRFSVRLSPSTEDDLMKRFACVAAVCLVATLFVGPSAEAQTAPAADQKWYVELNAGPTLGHKSDAFFGGEAGYGLTSDLFVIAEAGHMGNVGTSDLDDRAAVIADFLGATASTAFKVNYFMGGLRYNLNLAPSVHPYVLGEVG